MLRHRWADGTTHLRLDPLELLERLAVLTPRPRVNLILSYGVLAPRAAWWAALVPGASHRVDASHVEPSVEAAEDASRAKPSRRVASFLPQTVISFWYYRRFGDNRASDRAFIRAVVRARS